MIKKIMSAVALLGASVGTACAAGTAYFELPVGFSDNVSQTVILAAGAILVILALVFAWKITKSMVAGR